MQFLIQGQKHFQNCTDFILWQHKKLPNFNLCNSFMSPLDIAILFLPDSVRNSLPCSQLEQNILRKSLQLAQKDEMRSFYLLLSMRWLPITVGGGRWTVDCIFIFIHHARGGWQRLANGIKLSSTVFKLLVKLELICQVSFTLWMWLLSFVCYHIIG